MQSFAATITRRLFLLAMLPSTAFAGTALRLETPTGTVMGVSIESDWAADGIVFVNRRGIAKRSFRPETVNGRLQWVSRFGSVSFSMVGRGFATTGMNEAGLALAALHLSASEPPSRDDRHPMDSASWVQYALDVCGSIDDVLVLDDTVRLQDSEGIPNHFFVADASGDCAVLEYQDGKRIVHRGESLPIPVLTNMRYDKALEAHERGGAPWWWANPDRSAERFIAAAERLDAFDPHGRVAATDHVFGTLTGDVALPTTNWSITYDLTERTIRFKTARGPELKRISFDRLDFACDGPALMMSADAPPAGDGSAPLGAYDPDRNLQLFRGFLADHRLGVDESEAAELMRFLESFSCAP